MRVEHPIAHEGAERFNRDLRKLVHSWYSKGYAASLDRIPAESALAEPEWRSLLALTEPLIQATEPDPQMLRIAGQCYFHLKQNDAAIAAFKRAIEVGTVIHRTRFDFALVLYGAVGARTALNQFGRAIADVRHLSPLRRLALGHELDTPQTLRLGAPGKSAIAISATTVGLFTQ